MEMMIVKVADIQEYHKRAFVIEELRKYGYKNIEGKSYRELKTILATFRVKAESPSNSWF